MIETARAAAIARGLPRGAPVVVVPDGPRMLVATEPAEVVRLDGQAALERLSTLTPGWWAGLISYDLGRSIERVPERNPAIGTPDVLLARFDARAVVDSDGVKVEGHGAGARALMRAVDAPSSPPGEIGIRSGWESSLDRAEWFAAVAAIQELLHAGDCYQLNLTRQLSALAEVDPRDLFARIATEHPAPYRSLVSLGAPATVSASPEGFLRWQDGRISTRPIKGTDRSAARLLASEKDHAENVMIVDLARNDLDRVCVPGSVVASAVCELEQHPGLVHLVSTVKGNLLPGVDPGTLIAATFPPASVTGVPKARVLRAIEELEPVRRGSYCGAIGWIDTERNVGDLSVAIRTFSVGDGELRLGVGGGITIASIARAEWEETELKAARLLALAGAIDHEQLAEVL